MKRTIERVCAVLAAVLLAGLCGCGTAARWQKQYDMGVRYMSEGSYQEAVLAFKAAIQIDPKSADAYRMLAELYMRQGDLEAAMEVLKGGEAQMDDVVQADQLAEQLTEVRRSAAQERYESGMRAVSAGAEREAAEAFQTAVSLDPNNTGAYRALAELYVRQGDYDAAAEVLEQGVSTTGNGVLQTLLERIRDLASLDLSALVTDAYSFTRYVGEEALTYRIPRINLDGTETINRQIRDNMYSESEFVDAFDSYGGASASYEWTVKRGILSLVVEELMGSGDFIEYTDYDVYNISLLTKEALSTEDMVSAMGMTMGQYQRKARDAMGAAAWGGNRERGLDYYRDHSSREDCIEVQMFNQNLIADIAAENIQHNTYPFITADDELWASGFIYNGYHADEVLFNVSNPPTVPGYDKVLEDTTAETRISRAEAYKFACEYWNYTSGDMFYYEVGDGTSIPYKIKIEDTGLLNVKESGRQYYTFNRMCWSVDGGNLFYNGDVWVDAQTGECLGWPE